MRKQRTPTAARYWTLQSFLVLLLVACGNDNRTASTAPLVLSQNDMPAWKQVAVSKAPAPGLCGAPQAQALKASAANEGAAQFESPDRRQTIQELIFRRDDASATHLIAEVRSQLALCREYVAIEEHLRTTVVLSE